MLHNFKIRKFNAFKSHSAKTFRCLNAVHITVIFCFKKGLI